MSDMEMIHRKISSPTSLLIADDDPLIRLGLRHILEEQPNWKVVAEAQDGREAVLKAIETKPDVTILDIGMPEMNGLDACRHIVASTPKARILIVSMYETDDLVKKALAAGARGYLFKSAAARDLVSAVEAIRNNKTFFTAKVSQLVAAGYMNPKTGTGRATADDVCLTPRQREIVQMIANGKNNKEIAAILRISYRTIDTHRSNVMRRLNFHSVVELVRYAVRNHVVGP